MALGVVREWLLKDEETNEGKGLERVVFCCFEAKDEQAYTKLIPYMALSLDSLIQGRQVC